MDGSHSLLFRSDSSLALRCRKGAIHPIIQSPRRADAVAPKRTIMRAIGLVLLSIAIMALLLTDAAAKRRSSVKGSQAAGASGSWCATYSWKGINDNCSFATQQQCLAQVWGLGGFCRPNP